MKRKIDLLAVPYRDIPDNSIALVIDVIRATSTIVTFFGRGGENLLITEKIDEAFELKNKLEGEIYIAGERGGKKVEGFDFDNSPWKISQLDLKDKTLILTTTNGTKTIKRYKNNRYLFIGSFLNLTYLTNKIFRLSHSESLDINIISSGKEGNLVLDDLLCGGAFVETLFLKEKFELSDAARLSLEFYKDRKSDLIKYLLESESGRNITRYGKEYDIKFLSHIDKYNVAPFLKDKEKMMITNFKGDMR